MRIKLNVLDGRFGLSGQVERVSVGVIDGVLVSWKISTAACELRGISSVPEERIASTSSWWRHQRGRVRQTSVRLPSVMSVRKSLLAASLVADKVEQVVLNLKGKACVQAKGAQRLRFAHRCRRR